ncbi:MAG: NUMOD4 domain-containing protein [Hoylesella marshii]|uniref:NUMOD4 domain-containing protein n=1 Tax=Hoylesella marshii TaxID=189722 RepID=UPI003FA13780
MKDIEIWKTIPEFEDYEASNFGRIRSIDRKRPVKNGHTCIHKGKVIKARKQNGGYLVVWLRKNGKTYAKTVHRLIALTFIPPKSDKEVNHKDGDKTNNTIANLEWLTKSENIKHSYRQLGRKRNAQRILCVETGEIYASIKDAANKINITHSDIDHVLSGRSKSAGGYTWKRI